MPIYNKAVRDKIPEIIRAKGQACNVRTLDPGPWVEELERKLGEELNEYLSSGDLSELADLMEVIFAIAAERGWTQERFEEVRLQKRQERGGFEARLFLVETE